MIVQDACVRRMAYPEAGYGIVVWGVSKLFENLRIFIEIFHRKISSVSPTPVDWNGYTRS